MKPQLRTNAFSSLANIKPLTNVGEVLAVQSPDVALPAEVTNQIRNIPTGKIVVNPKQPRRYFDPIAMEELTLSITTKGVIVPILVVAQPDGTFMIVMGERRWRASMAAGLATIPAIVKDESNVDMLTDALIENLTREEMTQLDIGHALMKMRDELGLTLVEISKRVGKSVATISRFLFLASLPVEVQQLHVDGKLSVSALYAMQPIADKPQAIEAIAKAAVEKVLDAGGVEKLVKKAMTGGGAKAKAEVDAAKQMAKQIKTAVSALNKLLATAPNARISVSNNQVEVVYG